MVGFYVLSLQLDKLDSFRALFCERTSFIKTLRLKPANNENKLRPYRSWTVILKSRKYQITFISKL